LLARPNIVFCRRASTDLGWRCLPIPAPSTYLGRSATYPGAVDLSLPPSWPPVNEISQLLQWQFTLAASCSCRTANPTSLTAAWASRPRPPASAQREPTRERGEA